jgi:hypothetical protein
MLRAYVEFEMLLCEAFGSQKAAKVVKDINSAGERDGVYASKYSTRIYNKISTEKPGQRSVMQHRRPVSIQLNFSAVYLAYD